MSPDSISTRDGMLGGVLLVVLGIRSADLARTMVLAAVGAIVSMGVSLGLKALLRRGRL